MTPLDALFLTFFATFLWIVFILHKPKKKKHPIMPKKDKFIGSTYIPDLERKEHGTNKTKH